MTTTDSELRNYHLPEAVSRDITAIRVHPFTSKDGELYAVVELGSGGQLWLTDPAVARQLLTAAFGALRILDPAGAPALAKILAGIAAEQCDADWGSATLSQRCTLPAGHTGQHLDSHGSWSPAAELADAAIKHDPAGVADALIAAVATACRDCGSADCPLNEDGVCWNRASCAARVAEQAPRVEVTRDVEDSDRHNYLGRNVKAGEVFYVCHNPTYGAVDSDDGIALSESAKGYPFFEFPRDAVKALAAKAGV